MLRDGSLPSNFVEGLVVPAWFVPLFASGLCEWPHPTKVEQHHYETHAKQPEHAGVPSQELQSIEWKK